jgi:hypothetical protein
MKLAISSTRDLIALLAISGAIAAGSWLLLVDPTRGQLATLESERARLVAEVNRSMEIGGDIQRWTSRLRDATEQTRQLAAIASVAASDRAAIERLSELADRCGIVIDEMRPQEILPDAATAGRPAAPAPGAQPDKAAPADVRRSFRVILSGGYAPLAEFFRQLDNAQQLAVIRTARIVANGQPGSQAVNAEVTLDLFAPAVLLSQAPQPRAQGGAQ